MTAETLPPPASGPWTNNGGRIVSDAGIVAVVGTINEQSLQDTANARLIVAAHALLQAALRAETVIAGVTGGARNPVLDALHAAIAQAGDGGGVSPEKITEGGAAER